jgi:NtrC-family two-component system sensor histidine kinase KinB
VAATVVGVFLVAGCLWIFVTDLLLYALVEDQAIIARIETAKGGAFVMLAALLLYVVTSRSAARLAHAYATISAVLDSIGDGVLLLGRDRSISYANPAAVRMLRARSPSDLVGVGAPEFSRRYRVSYPDGHIVPPDRYVSQRVFDTGGVLNYKAILHPPGAPEVVISSTGAAVRSPDDASVASVVSVMHDITSTENLDRLRDGLFAATAHAVKTPVAVIKSATQVLAAGGSDPRRSIVTIERQCARIERLVENMLVLSRFRSSTLQLYPVLLALAPIVEAAVGEAARLAPDRDIRVEIDAGPRVYADGERLTMVLRNVMHGAIRSSCAQAPVTARLVSTRDEARIGVRYRPRLPLDHRENGVPGAVTDYDDVAVGQYVTSLIVQAHGGTLSEQSDDGHVTVWVHLPVAPENAT